VNMPATIVLERPDTPDAKSLVLELETHLEQFYPPESRHGLSVERLIQEQVAFFVVRDDDTPAGCGGVKLFGAERSGQHSTDQPYAEVKRMYVRPQFRGRGLGKLILDCLADHARQQGIRILRLETGIYQTEAIYLYERYGFRRIPPFGNYTDDPVSLCYEMSIAPS
jgi:putative acetyltransferase